MLLQCGTLISMKELCLEVSGFVFLKQILYAGSFKTFALSPQVQVTNFHCMSNKCGIKFWECIDRLSLSFFFFSKKNKKIRQEEIQTPIYRLEKHMLCNIFVPWSQKLYFNIMFFLFGNSRHEALIKAPTREKRKPLVKIVENLTFLLAQHLTALKDVIFFLPITSPKIFNPSNHMTS